MKNRYAICILAHHKPWLMMSSLISLFLQDLSNYDVDIHIIYIRGNGEFKEKKGYKKFIELSDNNNFNKQLSPDDPRILEILEKSSFDYTLHEVENDHGLDSGAWFKFIKKGIWKDYDYNFFFMEGFLFTNNDVFKNIDKFINKEKPEFIDVGYYKRMLSQHDILNYHYHVPNKSKLDEYHDECIKAVFEAFNKDKNFKIIFDNWKDDEYIKNNLQGTYHHTDDKVYSWKQKIFLSLKSFIKNKIIFNPFQNLVLIKTNKSHYIIPEKSIIKDYKEYGKVIFHLEKSPYFFGCSCQHIFSKHFLKKLDFQLEKNDLYSLIDVPFFASAMEVVWGFFPKWLNSDKWFYNGLHRPCKNFLNLKRDDSGKDLAYYLNLYYKNIIKTSFESDYIKIKKINNNYSYLQNILGESFYKK